MCSSIYLPFKYSEHSVRFSQIWVYITVCIFPTALINSVSVPDCTQLALKHRQGKNHKMRIIAFVGSPVEDSEKDVSMASLCFSLPFPFCEETCLLKPV